MILRTTYTGTGGGVTEDKRFYYHRGIDPKGLMRAAVSTATGRGIQGGSTITQQLVKNFFLTSERTLKRKANEMLMAVLLELHYDKNDILETYLNEVYFGQDGSRAIHGVGLASQFYFGRSVEQLKPHHSALLVAMLKGPTYYNPRRNPKRALERRNLVLAETGTQGYLTPQEFEVAIAQPLDVTRNAGMGLSNYPAFLDLVFRQLRRDYQEEDLRNEGLRIFSTLDPLVQQTAEKTLTEQLAQLEKRFALAEGWLDGAVVVNRVRRLKGKNEGYNADKDEYTDLVAAGIIDPAKVTRSALQNAASIAALLLTTEALVADKPEEAPAGGGMPDMGGMGGMM